MGDCAKVAGKQRRHRFRDAAFIVTQAMFFIAVFIVVPRVRAQETQSSPVTPTTQTDAASSEKLTFEVVSIKPSKPGQTNFGGARGQSGRFATANTTLRGLIGAAYHLNSGEVATRLIGAPSWIDSEHFDIEATAPGNPTTAQMGMMIQSMLADRFKLAVHRETRQLPVYALMQVKPGKLGPQLMPHSDRAKCVDAEQQPAPIPGEALPALCGQFAMFGRPPLLQEAGNKVTMAMLIDQLTNFVDRPILDRTGLTGNYDATLQFAFAFKRGNAPAGTADTVTPSDPSDPPSLFVALQEQLGLKLEASTGPVDMLVIDHVEEPTPN